VLVRKLLQEGADPDEKGGRYLYPIIAAMDGKAPEEYGNCDKEKSLEDVVQTLHQHRANPNRRSNSGESVLHWAVSKGDVKVVSLLVEAGAAVKSCDSEGRTPLHDAVGIPAGCITAYLLSKGARVQVLDADNNSPLHLAAKRSSLGVVQILIRAGSDKYLRNKVGARPLDLAAESGRPEVLNYLRELQVEEGMKSVELEKGRLLDPAAENGNLAAISTLLASGADTDARDAKGRTAPHIAAFWGQDGQTPLHIAAKEGVLNGFCRLLDAKVNTKFFVIMLDGQQGTMPETEEVFGYF
jgi:ankyrin repeat protein